MHPLPDNILYEVPLATLPFRIIMGSACLLFVVGIYGFWLPKFPKFLKVLPGKSLAQKIIGTIIFILPIIIGLAPAVILLGLIENQSTYITNTGVISPSLFHRTPTIITWDQITRVTCTMRHNRPITTLTIVASDNRRIQMGNAGHGDLDNIHELLTNQLGATIVRPCYTH
jgi:hypothetical protein